MDENKIKIFVVNVIEALSLKSQDSKYSHLSSIADQLANDVKVNLNRAMRLAMRVNNAHNLNVKG